jgi:ATP-binding cassette, subfamily B, multidrug efflux pump
LRYGKEDATIFEIEAASQSAAASEFIDKLEERYAHLLKQGATNLSGGQKQRLSMTRAFVREPNILIFDDSTSAIDAISEAAVQDALKQKYTDATVFIISSKVSSVREAHQIIVMEDGMIEAIGTHEDLLSNSKVYQDIYRSQSGREVASYE